MEEYRSMTRSQRCIGTVLALLWTLVGNDAVHAQDGYSAIGGIPPQQPGSQQRALQQGTFRQNGNQQTGFQSRGNFEQGGYPARNERQGPVRQARIAPQALGNRIDWNEFERARIMARVGDDIVLAGDIVGLVDQQLAPYKDKVPEDQLALQRDVLIRRQLNSTVERKTLYQSFIRTIPHDRREEALGGVWEQVTEKFNEEELPKAMKQAKVETRQELEEKLRDYGWSLRKQIRSYGERQLGMYGVFQKIDRTPEVTHAEMLVDYKANLEDYRVLAKSKFEKLTVRFDRFDSEQAAYDAIVEMGDQVVLGGAPFRAVAKRSSQGIYADEGGAHDWTERGSLASEPINNAIFSIPIGRMSRILRDDRGFHIVRVTERVDEQFTTFLKAQAEIKKKLEGDKRQVAFEKYIASVKSDIPVWTIFDDEDAALRVGEAKSRASNGSR